MKSIYFVFLLLGHWETISSESVINCIQEDLTFIEKAVCRCFTKIVFLKISQISQETHVLEPLFDKVVLK